MDEIIIKVSLSMSEDGYVYDIYLGDEAYMECDPAGGGICTSTMSNAIDMAVDEAKELIAKSEE